MKKIFKYWKSDMLAGLSVSFVALPLSMGIALAVGYPIQAGILAAIVGGMLGWVLGGTHVGIKGPGAGSIVALITAFGVFSESGLYQNPLAVLLTCTLIAGGLLVLTGVFRLGNYAQILPSGAINGLLAGIGFIIVVKQMDELFCYTSEALSPVDALAEIPSKIIEANPISLVLGIISILILIYHRRVPSKTVRTIPAAIWVLLINVAIVLTFGLHHNKVVSFLGMDAQVGDNLLISIDKNAFASFNMPNFKGFDSFAFWVQAINIFIILLVENLLSAKAIDKIDPLSRKTNLDKDLSSSGFTTVVSSLIGGMPAITVIARSSVNVNVGGMTRFSNFSHGLVLAIMLIIAIPFINLLPKEALAAVLVVAGYRLCSPLIFQKAFKKGWEQLVIFTVTFYATLRYGLLTGIIVGTIMDFLLSFFLADSTLVKFWKSSKHPYIKLKEVNDRFVLKMKGVINFFSLLKIEKALNQLPENASAKVDLSETEVVDRTILEYLSEQSVLHEKKGGYLDITGLGNHHSSSPHPAALHLLETTWKKNSLHTQRQIRLKRYSLNRNFDFKPEPDYHIGHYQTFPYFKTRPFEYRFNLINGFWDNGVQFQVADVIFHEGGFNTQDSLHTTVLSFTLKKEIPQFSIEHFSLYDRIRDFAFRSDAHIHFSALDDEVQIVGEKREVLEAFFTPELIATMSAQKAYYIESNGSELLIFRNFKLASIDRLKELVAFGELLNHTF